LGYDEEMVVKRSGGHDEDRDKPYEGLEFARKIESRLQPVLRHDAA
jgi:hypothetical protein